MAGRELVAVIGLGEIGKPLFDLIAEKYTTTGIDIDTKVSAESFDILHICYPFHGDDFVTTTVEYIHRFHPSLVVVNSTVAVGTTRKVFEIARVPIVNSPVRGKHANMRRDLLLYAKFIGGIDEDASRAAEQHFSRIGMKTKSLKSPEASELAKLTETTYFGLLITWAQEVERYCQTFGVDYDEVASIYEEINYLPRVKFFPGLIGGHCVMPNIALLKSALNSDVLDAIEGSNELKKALESSAQRAAAGRGKS
jgi:UDP-N-acetyl-D-mannosaminuronate dehydrogenase